MSADTWTAAAIVGRNLLLNWLVILPILIGVLLLLKFYAGAIDWLSWANRDVCTMSLSNPRLSDAIGIIGIALLLVALSVRSYHMPSRGHSTLTQKEFLRFDLVPTVLAALFFVWALATPCLHNVMAGQEDGVLCMEAPALIWCGLVGGMALYLAELVCSERRRYAGFIGLPSLADRLDCGRRSLRRPHGDRRQPRITAVDDDPGDGVGHGRDHLVNLRRALGDDEPVGRGDHSCRTDQRAGRVR